MSKSQKEYYRNKFNGISSITLYKVKRAMIESVIQSSGELPLYFRTLPNQIDYEMERRNETVTENEYGILIVKKTVKKESEVQDA